MTGQARTHWPQPMQSSYFMKRRMRLFGGSGHFSLGYCSVTGFVNRCRQVIRIPTSTVKKPSQTSCEPLPHRDTDLRGRRAPCARRRFQRERADHDDEEEADRGRA